ncbi:hemin uptake protein HemP [Halovulum dunhuangense]|uniref:Hemin uptake protein HemP n=1 Tax=Halovulum dunhuangense TaxID=1505036 RepID=A0A849KXB1_9RHOB|nr:hemin uptake protein HemP [Halovulum dunhuangense]NNU79137.1 hemin uptake protein HemP [Halovulum dunhuangense]
MTALPTRLEEEARSSAPPIHRAEHLTDGGTQARIVLRDQVYTLRITRAGKLILTK